MVQLRLVEICQAKLLLAMSYYSSVDLIDFGITYVLARSTGPKQRETNLKF